MEPSTDLPTLPAGSDSELIAAFLQGTEQSVFVATELLRDELLGLASLSDAVLPVKTAWWHDELNRAARGEARHPVTRMISAAPYETTPDWDVFAEHLRLVEAWCRGEQVASAEEMRLRLFRRHGPGLYWCFDQANGVVGGAQLSDYVHRLAIARGFVEDALRLRSSETIPFSQFPDDWVASLSNTSDKDSAAARRERLARHCLDAAAAELTKHANRVTGVAAIDILAALIRLALKKRDNAAPPGRWRRLMAAWHAARRSGRTKQGPA